MENTEAMRIPMGSWYTEKRIDDETIIITGYDPTQKIIVGSQTQLFTEPPRSYQVVEMTRRDHVGEFIDPKNAVNSHYTATMKELN